MSIKKGKEKERRIDNISGSGSRTRQLYWVTQHSYMLNQFYVLYKHKI